MPVHYRACNLCEAICGLAITYEGNTVLSITGDRDDPFSRGHICPKAVALKDIYEDPDRLKLPQKRTASGWETIGWAQAFDEVADRLRQIRAEFGPNAIGYYAGNPSVHNSGTFLTSPGFVKAVGTRNVFSASSVDQFPHHFAAWQLFGHPLLLPIPDIDRTDYWLIIGGNPIVSNGSIMTAPDVATRLRAVQERGGKVVVIDPRRTETAKRADEHHFIRPGTDVFLLLAMVQTLFAENLVKLGRLADFTNGLDTLRNAVQPFTPDSVAAQTGMSAEVIRQLTRDLAGAGRAACYGRVGVSVQQFGGLCLWLIDVISILTGNLDEPGGMMFTSPAIDVVPRSRPDAPIKPYNRYGRYHSRVSQYPEFMGELPVACLAEEILTPRVDSSDTNTPGEGPIRAMVTSCGNPVLSTPNGRRLDEAFAQLDFMVSIDIYCNETTRHADYILPPATGLETAHYDLTFHALAIRNTTRYSTPLFARHPDQRYDWEIFDELRLRLDGDAYNADTTTQPQDPAGKIDAGLRYGPYGKTNNLSLQMLLDQPHGLDLGALQAQLPDRLATVNKQINVAPALLLTDLNRAVDVLRQNVAANSTILTSNPPTDDMSANLLLISRRHLRSNNSWMHNSHRLVKGPNRCTLQMNAADAEKRGLETGQLVRVSSRVGAVELPVEVTADMMPGVVCMPHGYGHTRPGVQLNVAAQHAGVSVNDLTDETFVDELTGNAALSGVPVSVVSV